MFRSALAVTTATLMLGALGMSAPTANAQQMTTTTSTGAVYFGGGVGLSIPIGSLGDVNKTGWNIQGMGGWESQDSPWGFRGDLTYNSFGGKSITANGNTTDYKSFGIVSLTADAVWKQHRAAEQSSSSTPYFLAGLGLYNRSAGSVGSFTKFGVNGGGGLEFPLTGFSVYADARLHWIFSGGKSAVYLPITIGVKVGGV